MNCFFTATMDDCFFFNSSDKSGRGSGLTLGSTFCVPQTVRRAVGSSWAVLTVPLSLSLYMEKLKIRKWTRRPFGLVI